MKTELTIYGIQIRLTALTTEAESTVKALEKELSPLRIISGNFVQPKSPKSTHTIQVILDTSGTCTNPRQQWALRMGQAQVALNFEKRICKYGDRSFVELLSHKENKNFNYEIRISSPSPHALYELSYVSLMSSMGLCLDLHKFHRVHALGLTIGAKSGLIILNQGMGKSALASLLLKITKNVQLYSDECPLIHDGKIFPFPISIALRPGVAAKLNLYQTDAFRMGQFIFPKKSLFRIPKPRIASARTIDFVLIGKKATFKSHIRPANKLTALWALLKSCVLGLGLLQMVEYLLQWKLVAPLIQIAFSRLKESLGLLKSAHVYVFEVTDSAADNFKELLQFFRVGPISADLLDSTLDFVPPGHSTKTRGRDVTE